MFNLQRIKIFPLLFFVAFYFLSLLFLNKSAYACTINMPDWSTQSVEDCLYAGGSINLVGTYGNFGSYYKLTADIIAKYNQTRPTNQKVTLELRLYNDSRPLTQNEIQSAIAIMQQNSINAPAMLRINNEPTDGYAWSGLSYSEKIASIAKTQYWAKQAAAQSGGGIYIVSEMLDLWNGQDPEKVWIDVGNYIKSHASEFPNLNVSGTSDPKSLYFQLHDVYSINGYFYPDKFGKFGDGGLTLGTVLSKLPPGTPWRFSEFGYMSSETGLPSYSDISKLEQNVKNLVSFLANNPRFFATFAGLGIFTRDPHDASAANITKAIAAILKNNPQLGSAIMAFENPNWVKDEAAFKKWLEQLIKDGIIVECKDSDGTVLGYAPTLEQCSVDFAIGTDSRVVCSINGAIPPSNTYPFRPNPCKNCSLNVPKPSYSCAQAPAVIQYKEFSCTDVVSCPEDPGKFIAPIDWDTVTFNLNTKGAKPDGSEGTKVPFVGYKEVCRSTAEERTADPKSCNLNTENRSTNPNDYLNDYFEGSALFDERYFDMSNPNDWSDLWWEYGIYRKLTPLEAQDSQRINMINRGFNYLVKTKVKNADGSIVLKSRTMQEWAADMQPYDKRRPGKKGRLPPVLDLSRCTDPNVQEGCVGSENIAYSENYADWLTQDWGQLWYSIPFFSREDAPGKVILTIEHEPGTINEAATSSREEIPLSIPHLTRLYESTTAIYNILKPTMDKELAVNPESKKTAYQTTSQQKPFNTPLLLAKAGISDSTEPKLLAQAGPAQNTQCDALTVLRNSDGSFSFREHLPNGCYYRDVRWKAIIEADGQTTSCEGFSPVISNPEDSDPGSADRTPSVNIPCTLPGNNVKVTVIFDSGGRMGGEVCDSIPQFPSCSCSTQKQADGSIKTSCSTGAILPSPPPCSNGSNIDTACTPKNPKIDPQPNDEICCKSTAAVNVKSYLYSDSEIKPCSCRELQPGEDPPLDGIGNVNWAALCSNTQKYTAKMSRQVEVKLAVPYLREVWQKTSGPGLAIFNLFRPKQVGDFEEADALTNLTYEVSSAAQTYLSFSGIDDNLLNQASLRGDLYLPYLGGIFAAKKCVSEVILTPENLRTGENWCRYKAK